MAVKALSPNHWATREFPDTLNFYLLDLALYFVTPCETTHLRLGLEPKVWDLTPLSFN